MDEELLNLFLAAQQGNKGISGTLNNLDNQMLIYLAGQYNPLSAMGITSSGGGQLTARYAGKPDYPAVNQLLAQIQQGDDEYQYGTAVKALITGGQTDGLDSGEFERLASDLYQESTGQVSPSKKTYWQQRGLSDPTDVYSLENLPNRPGLNKVLSQFATAQAARQSELDRASQATESLRKSVAPLYDREFTTGDLLRYLKEDPEGQKLAKERGIDMSKVSKEGDVYTWRGTQRKKRSRFDPRNLTEAVSSDLFRFAEDLGRTVAGGQTKTLAEAVGGTGKIVAGQDAQKKAYRDALSKQKRIEDDMKLDEYRANKFANEYLKLVQARGETPLGDELKGVMRFMAQNR